MKLIASAQLRANIENRGHRLFCSNTGLDPIASGASTADGESAPVADPFPPSLVSIITAAVELEFRKSRYPGWHIQAPRD